MLEEKAFTHNRLIPSLHPFLSAMMWDSDVHLGEVGESEYSLDIGPDLLVEKQTPVMKIS